MYHQSPHEWALPGSTPKAARALSRFLGRATAATAAVALVAAFPAWAQPAGAPGSAAAAARNFDARIELGAGLAPKAPTAAQLAAVSRLRSDLPDLSVTFDPDTGVTRSLYNATGFLTAPDRGTDPQRIASSFLHQNLDLLGLSAADLAGLEVTDVVESSVTGTTHIYLRQSQLGLPVYNGQLQIHVAREGQILSINNALIPDLDQKAPAAAPRLTPESAIGAVADHLGLHLAAPARRLSQLDGPRRQTRLEAPQLSRSPIDAGLMWLPVGDGAQLVWNLRVETLDGDHWYDLTVDAASGQVLTRFDWTADASYRVYPQPVESPNHTTPTPPADGRILVTNPQDATASPNGWHSTGTSSFTIPRGNNVHAYEDRDANNAPPTTQPNCGTSLVCDFPIDLTLAPSAYIPAAVTNLFYWNNIIHDIQYQYGFNEAAGNFQVNNFGRGGAGNDDVKAEAQDGSGTNNANFSTPPDGSSGRMQMFIWTAPTPDKDGDLDSGIVVHEYGHGISIRQVGGPSNSSCLNNSQQPGEGWSDWFALAYTAEVGDAGTDVRGIGTYALNQPTTGTGIRAQPYSTNPTVNTWTYASISGASIPHGVGAVWAQGIWEVYWALVGKWGFSSNLYNALGGAGNQRAMLYINEGLKNTACSPTFLDARNGIIQAATTLFGGEDVCLLWQAFAAYGLGTDASTPGSNSTTATNGFSVPASCGGPPPPPPPGGCTTPTTLYTNGFETGTGLGDWTRGTFVAGGSTTDWRGIQTCTAQGGSRIFRFGGSTCTANYGNSRFTFAQPAGSTGIAVPAGTSQTRLKFGHRRRFESGFDGGTLTLSLDGTNYFFVPGSAIVSGSGYNGTAGGTCQPAGAAGAAVFTGVQTTFVNTEVDLDSVCNAITGGTGGCAGRSLRIGFTSITDCSVTDDGWFLDNVTVTACPP